MDVNNELEIITTDEDWLNLRAGEQARVRGTIGQGKQGANTILVTFPWNWQTLAVEVSDLQGLHQDIEAGRSVEVKVTRTHDGVSCVSKDIIVTE